MNNEEKFQEVFGYYATEMWAKPEAEFLDWINEEYNTPATPKPVCEDAISKRKLMTELQGIWDACTPNNMTDFQDMLEDIYYKIKNAPSVTPTEQNEEDILKFYYVESLDEYWIGQRCGTRYYGKWTGNCFTFGYSIYLPWGEHVVAPDTLWKEHTYPSEPKEIPFNEWLQGFLEKELQTERTGEWKEVMISTDSGIGPVKDWWYCSLCNNHVSYKYNYCPNCGADMRGDKE